MNTHFSAEEQTPMCPQTQTQSHPVMARHTQSQSGVIQEVPEQEKAKMAKNGQRWPKMVKKIHTWQQMDKDGQNKTKTGWTWPNVAETWSEVARGGQNFNLRFQLRPVISLVFAGESWRVFLPNQKFQRKAPGGKKPQKIRRKKSKKIQISQKIENAEK